jgi:hypothetical protein
MAIRPSIADRYPAFQQAQAQTDDEADEPKTPIKSIKRTRMQPAKDPELTKRDALIKAGAGLVAGVLVAKAADKAGSLFPEDKKETSPPDAQITAASLEKEVMRRKTKGKKNNYKTIMRRFASAKASADDSRSRIEYARQKINASNLPAMVKAILPYLPMQESSYKLCTSSKDNAVGPWQFIPGTAEKYKLKGRDFDRRCNFKAATNAAIAYFKDIVKKLKASKHFKTLESRYSTQAMEDFLSLITINAFNSGEAHMVRAMKLLANEKKIRKEVDNAALNGGQGLYVYMTKIYNAKSTGGLYKGKYGKKYQNGIRPKYANISSRYVFDILAYKWLHEGQKAKYKEAQNIRPLEDAPSKPSKISTLTASVSAAAITVLGYLGIKAHEQGKKYVVDAMLSKRELLGLGVATGAAALGGAAENQFDIVKKVGSIELSCDGEDKEKGNGVEYNASDIKKHVKAIKKACRCEHVSDATIIHPKNYKFTRRLADSAYAKFNRSSDYKFALIAKYYYRRCLHLIDMQLKGKYPLPRRGGKDTVLKRKKYIERALGIINS